jgi:hypothetical protein
MGLQVFNVEPYSGAARPRSFESPSPPDSASRDTNSIPSASIVPTLSTKSPIFKPWSPVASQLSGSLCSLTRSLGEQSNTTELHLLTHFVTRIQPWLFPVSGVGQHVDSSSIFCFPDKVANKAYFFFCLGLAATDLRAASPAGPPDEVAQDQFCCALSELRKSLSYDSGRRESLETILGMLFTQRLVGQLEDSPLGISWYQHFDAATELVHQLEIPVQLAHENNDDLAVVVYAWIDILGSTLIPRSPKLVDTYRKKYFASTTLGFLETMGCDDRVMFLISEIACLEAKLHGQYDGRESQWWQDYQALSHHLNALEWKSTAQDVGQERRDFISELYRTSALIYLFGLLPGVDHNESTLVYVVESISSMLNSTTTLKDFEYSMIWPMLIAGVHSAPSSSFRTLFHQFAGAMEKDTGVLRRLDDLLNDLWRSQEFAKEQGADNPDWRQLIRNRGCESLLI